MERVNCLKCSFFPQRYVLALMGFLANVVYLAIRVCLSVAIIEMAVPFNNTETGTDSLVCPVDAPVVIDNDHERNNGPRYEWTQEEQGWILSAFFFGNVFTQIPGGLLAEKYGGKWTLSLGILVMAVGSIATAPAVRFGGHFALISLRIVMGIVTGSFFPAISVLIAAWVPEKERGRLGSFIFSGSSIGSLLSLYLTGWMLSHWHWPVVFYFWGSVAIVWFFIFTLLCSSDPASNPFITKDELEYLQNEIGQLQRNETLPSPPWKQIFTNVPVLALIVAQVIFEIRVDLLRHSRGLPSTIGHDWVYFIMATDLPKYMREVLGFSFYDVGLYTSVPWFVAWIVANLSGILCDLLINRGFLTPVRARKIFTGISGVLPAIFIVAASYAGCDKVLVVILFVIGIGSTGAHVPGFMVNALDLSPNYAGSLLALSNNLGSIAGVVAPTFVGIMAPNSAMEEWRFVFWITFGIVMVKTIVYSVWASAEVQPFNSPRNFEKPEGDSATTERRKNLPENTV